MRWRALALLICLHGQIWAGDGIFPAVEFREGASRQVFDFPARAHSDEIRVRVLAALSKPNRDELLGALVGTKQIAGESWFDLRGIQVNAHELDGHANFSRTCWDNARFSDLDLSGADLNGALLRSVSFSRVNLSGAVLDNANLQGADFLDCNLSNSSILRATYSPTTQFRQCELVNVRFDTTQGMAGVQFSGCNLRDAIFQQARLPLVKFVNSDLTEADFGGADLSGAEFYNTIITGVDFTDALLVGSKLQASKLIGNLRLVRTTLGSTMLGDLDISKIDMTYVIWQNGNYWVGEEMEADRLLAADHGRSNQLHAAELYAKSENIYRALAQRYRTAGYLREYAGLRVRSNEARRKLLALEDGHGISMEALGLNLGRLVDEYHTNPFRYFLNLILTVLSFATVFTGALLFRAKWFVWYRIQPDGKEFITGEDGTYVRQAQPLEDEILRPTSPREWVAAIRKLWVVGLELSFEALFRFVEHIIDIPNLVHLFFRTFDMRPLPKAWIARILYGFEAWIGIFFLYYGSRMVLLVIGGN